MPQPSAAKPLSVADEIASHRPRDEGPCSFCGHVWEGHTGNSSGRTACAAPRCPEVPTPGIGRCAVYTSHRRHQATIEFMRHADQPVTITPNQLADVIHRSRHGGPEGHQMILSCSCLHEAMFLLGF
jgi:hypothetical protein